MSAQLWDQRNLWAAAAYLYQQEEDRKERITVGVNQFVAQDESLAIPILRVDEAGEQRQRLKSSGPVNDRAALVW